MFNFVVWNLREDIDLYEAYIKKCSIYTPYHLSEFLLAEQMAEEGIIKVFLYEEETEFALLPMVVREINSLFPVLENKKKIYDMITPHEYGGIVSNSLDTAIQEKLLKSIFYYCRQNNIIFQFIRLNPYLKDLPSYFRNSNYEMIYSCAQVYINLNQSKEEIINQYKPNVRWGIRRAKREELSFEIAEKTQKNIEIFKNMYEKAMIRLNAEKFLYFNDNYFYTLLKCECSRLCFVRDCDGTIIACSILLLGMDIVYYHLSCFDKNYASKRPMNYILSSMVLWSKEMGFKKFHLGGGKGTLLQSKEAYSPNRIDYYIAYCICNENKYQEICDIWRTQFPQYSDKVFYPLYRYV